MLPPPWPGRTSGRPAVVLALALMLVLGPASLVRLVMGLVQILLTFLFTVRLDYVWGVGHRRLSPHWLGVCGLWFNLSSARFP